MTTATAHGPRGDAAVPEGAVAAPFPLRTLPPITLDVPDPGSRGGADCLLVAEPTPLLLLALLGRHALDLLLVPGTEVRIADLAADGLPPGWLSVNAGRVALQRTRPADGPSRAGLDGRIVADAVHSLSCGGRGVFAIADDGAARSAIMGRDLPGVRLLSTRGFLRWVGSAFGVASAAAASRELAAVSGLARA